MRSTLARTWRLTPVLTLVVSLSAGPLAAPAALAATAKSTAGDWSVSCASGCQMLQAVSASDGKPAFLITVSQQHNDNVALITVPLRSYLAPGIEIRVDGGRPFKANYELCDEAGCHAGFKLGGAVLNAFRKGTIAWVRVWNASDKAADFPVSLNGFSAAFAGLGATGNNATGKKAAGVAEREP